MKLQTERPSEKVMRYFTPELYIQFGSTNDREADQADEAWEHASRRYRDHLATIRDQLPSQARKLADLCLHDADLLAVEEDMQSYSSNGGPTRLEITWSAIAIFSLKQDTMIRSLFYLLWDRIRSHPAPKNWRVQKGPKRWLYDEVDLSRDRHNAYLHRILFSDGEVLEVPFLTAFTSAVTVPSNGKSNRSRRSA